MPLQNLFLILLMPIVFYETFTAYYKIVPDSKRLVYKTMTWFSFFVLVQLVLITYEDQILNKSFYFPIWGLMFLFYGPYFSLIFSTYYKEQLLLKYDIYLADFYSMIGVFICGLVINFMESKLPYVFEIPLLVLGLSLLFYAVRIQIKKNRIKGTLEVLDRQKNREGKGLFLSFGCILIVFFFRISQDIKLSGFLFLLLFYVYLAFLRKMMENKIIHMDEVQKNTANTTNEPVHIKEYSLSEKQELNRLKYGQSKLNDIVLQRCNIKVNQIIVENKAFLDANFKMTDLATQTRISRYYLAQYFNVVHRMNFREYINKLRIDSIVQYINANKYKEDISVNELFLKSAFNSKTSFFKSFKQFLGCTPFEYLKKNQR
ncbi:helix-turn-helix domain-containing protein [Myroides odoratus]|uniref:helix-turn-helix domain-containing protein n=1 Tax=Myroides odoratus TaxID=256 RepID=UPI0039B127A7